MVKMKVNIRDMFPLCKITLKQKTVSPCCGIYKMCKSKIHDSSNLKSERENFGM